MQPQASLFIGHCAQQLRGLPEHTSGHRVVVYSSRELELPF